MQLFDLSTPAKRFRFIAILEAITWLALLISMAVKYGADNESATFVPGMVHGVVFVCFVVVSLLTARALKWNFKVTAWALFSSIPPFGSIVFELWAQRRGHLAELSDAAAVEPVPAPAA